MTNPFEDVPDIPHDMLDSLLGDVQNVETPLLLTITTQTSCVVLGNTGMKNLDAHQKAGIYLLMNSVLIEELAEWGDEEDDDDDD